MIDVDPPPDYFNDCCYPRGFPTLFSVRLPNRADPDLVELAQAGGALTLTGRHFAFDASQRHEAANMVEHVRRTYFPDAAAGGQGQAVLFIGTASISETPRDRRPTHDHVH